MSRTNPSLKRVIADFKVHPWLHLLSISTITIALLLLGGFLLCKRNFEQVSEYANPQISGTIYLREALIEPEIDRIKEKILALENVQKVEFKSKASVVEELHEFLGGQISGSLPGSELFPDVLEISVSRDAGPRAIGVLKSVLERYPEVSEVDFSEDWLAQYRKVRQFLGVFGFVLMIAIVSGCSFLIANFMGMRHQSRRSEIEIVRLVGASDKFVLTPFIIEGLVEGIIGGGVALLALYVVRGFFLTIVSNQWNSILGIKTWLFLSPLQFLTVIAIGIAMALLGSFTVFLRFKENEVG